MTLKEVLDSIAAEYPGELDKPLFDDNGDEVRSFSVVIHGYGVRIVLDTRSEE
jgi:hypothetical protein